MSASTTEELVERLAAAPAPVRPLAPPLRRAALTLAGVTAVGALLVLVRGNVDGLLARYSGRETLMFLEMAAMLLTALVSTAGAFVLAVPGRSRRWLLAPLPPFAAWVLLSGLGCYRDLLRLGTTGWEGVHDADCFLFILAAGTAVGIPLLWRLARARPIEPLPVALLGGLGAAALAAFLLQFFHPSAVTLVDLGLHFAAVALLTMLAASVRNRALAPV
jgi:hypothetical protein